MDPASTVLLQHAGLRTVAIGYINNDAFADVVANYNGALYWHAGDGTGAISPSGTNVGTLVGTSVDTPNCEVVDMDGDLDNDILVTSDSTGSLQWYNNLDGNGIFAVSYIATGLSSAPSMVVADLLDDNGLLDIVVPKQGGGGSFLLYPGTGSGFFGAPVTLAATPTPKLLALGDMDGDGRSDVVSTSASPGYVSWYRNNVTHFEAARLILATVASGLAVGDLDGDGKLDVVVSSTDGIDMLLGTGGGAFAVPERLFATQLGMSPMALLDVNSDGMLDIVGHLGDELLASPNTGAAAFPLGWLRFDATMNDRPGKLMIGRLDPSVPRLMVAKNGGAQLESFSVASAVAFPSETQQVTDIFNSPRRLATFDVDLDGLLDVAGIAVRRFFWSTTSATGTASAPEMVVLTHDPLAFAVADLDGDRCLDVVLAGKGALEWLRSDCLGGFVGPVVINDTVVTALGMANAALDTGDLDGSGRPSIVTATAAGVVWLRNLGDASFGVPQMVAATSDVSDLQVADTDRDGHADVLWCAVGGAVWWAKGNGAGVFVASEIGSITGNFLGIDIGDINGDGWLDVVAAGSELAWWPGGPGGAWGATREVPSLANNAVPLLADLSRTGHLQLLLVSAGTGNRVDLFDNNGTDFAGAVLITNSITKPMGVALGDLTRDGFPDLVLSSNVNQGPVSIWAATSSPSALPPVLTSALPECGGVPGTPSCLAAVLGRATDCFPASLSMPDITGCFLRDHLPIAASSVTLHDTTIDCGAAGGVLFSVGPGVHLTLRNVTVRASTIGKGLTATTALRVQGDSARLTLQGLTADGADSRGADPVSQASAGYGSLVAVIDGADLEMHDSHVSHCLAGTEGGVLALVGALSTAVITDTVMANNTAGGGGAILVSGQGASVAADGLVLHGNHVSGRGGAIHVTGDTAVVTVTGGALVDNVAEVGGAVAVTAHDARITIRGGATIHDNTATWGGTVSALAPDIGVPDDPAQLVRRDAGPGHSLVTLIGSVTSSHAVYGGLAFACGAEVNATGGGLTAHASAAGGLAFVCATAGGGVETWVRLEGTLDGAVGASGAYGALLATPVTALVASGLPASVVSGTALGAGVVHARDAFGQSVRTPLALGVSVDGSGKVEGPVLAVSPEDGAIAVGAQTVGALAWTGGSLSAVDLVFTVEGTSVVETTPLALDACPVDWGRASANDEQTPLVCAPCEDGTESDTVSVDACTAIVACGGEAVLINGSCVTCPENTQRLSSDGDPLPCTCVVGYWVRSGRTDEACEACPSGGLCEGGTAMPVAAPGFAPSSDTPGTFARCRFGDDACRGAAGCATGYVGYLCKDCADDYYRDSTGRCVACPPAAVGALSAMFLTVVLMAVGGVAFVMFTLISERRKLANGGTPGKSRKLVPHSLSALLVFLQIVGLVGDAPLDWPGPVRSAMTAANAASVNTNLFAADCSLGGFGTSYVVSMVLPVLFVLVVVLSVVVVWLVRRALGVCTSLPSAGVVGTLERLLFVVGPLGYIPMCRSTLVLFDCSRLADGKWYLDADLSVECGSAFWWRLVPVGLLGVIIYVLTLPMVVASVLYASRRRLGEADVLARFGSLYGMYRKRYYGYQVLLLLKRVSVVCIALFFSSTQVWLLFALIAVFGVAGAIQIRFDPFLDPLYNSLEARLNIAVLVLVLCGAAFWADDFPDSASRTLFIVVSFIVLAIAVACVVWVAVKEVRGICTGADRVAEGCRESEFWRMVDAHAPDLDVSLVEQIGAIRNTAGGGGADGAASIDTFAWLDDNPQGGGMDIDMSVCVLTESSSSS